MKCFSLDENVRPDAWVAEQLSKTREVSEVIDDQAFALHFKYIQTYLPGQPTIELIALIHTGESGCSFIHLSVFPFSAELVPVIQSLLPDLESIRQFTAKNHFSIFNVSAPWVLDPVYIPKPWGQEIWFTGIEIRGQAAVRGENGNLPLPWVLSLFPQANQKPLILLKVLDPLPDDVYGDLYFELHEEKQEVYVVTHVNEQAWPDGKGVIQLGFAPKKRDEYESAEEFKKAYLNAVRAYEQVRRVLDGKLDELCRLNNFNPDAPIPVEQLKNWIKELSQSIENKELIKEEKRLKALMNSFVNHLPLTVGDTLAIPTLVPHALQHGVRVVEFQTPVYERKILSFAQKVLTQNHWDTESALSIVNIDCLQIPLPEILVSNEQVKVEKIVCFDDFFVHRININSGSYQPDLSGYSLVMSIAGELSLMWDAHHQVVSAGEVVLLPGALANYCRFVAEGSCLFLHASPRIADTL